MTDEGRGRVDRPADDRPAELPPRPLLERLGLALVAAAMAAMFGFVGVAAWLGGEGFLAVMGGLGSLMTIWVGALTLFRR